MDDETKEALEKSIAKWEKNLAAKKWWQVVASPQGCPLCGLYFYKSDPCKGCPVYTQSGDVFCHKTPYELVTSFRHDEYLLGEGVISERAREAIKAEVEFLKSLRKST
jgi:hypothetical protein